jgi:subtilisin
MLLPRRHRPLAVVLASGVLLLSIAAPAIGADRRGPVQVGTDELARDSWLVTLVDGADPAAEAPGLSRAAGGSSGLVYHHAMHGFQFRGSPQAAAALGHNPRVASVQADSPVYLTDLLPHGVDRVEAWDQAGTDGSYQQGFRGRGARIAIMDTGIDLDHPDLVGGIDAGLGINCVNPSLPPNDGYGHGTHVSGTAAAPYNGTGIVGIAPEARLVPIKVFDDAGNSAESMIMCGFDRIMALNTDGDPANDIDVVNMSWGEQRAWGDCASDPLHTAICRLHDAGIILVGGAGNAAGNADQFVPAAYPEVIGVSALADFDGAPGGFAGCPFVFEILWYECDDTFAFFSNSGASVDLIAPGVQEYSTYAGGGYQTSSGTSMATPHITGIAALMAAAAPGLSPDAALAALISSGECPDGRPSDADGVAGCTGQGTWPDDPDGIPEPMGNAIGAALAVAGSPPPDPDPPSAPALTATAGNASVKLDWTVPADDGGADISGYEIYRRTSGSPETVVAVGNVLTYTDTGRTNGTTYLYQVAAVNSEGAGARSNQVSATPQAPATVPSAPRNLVGTKVANGIRLTWLAPTSTGGSSITRYLILRSTVAGAETFRAEVPSTQLTFTDTAVAPRTQYFYVVIAENAVGPGPRSNEVKVRSR